MQACATREGSSKKTRRRTAQTQKGGEKKKAAKTIGETSSFVRKGLKKVKRKKETIGGGKETIGKQILAFTIVALVC